MNGTVSVRVGAVAWYHPVFVHLESTASPSYPQALHCKQPSLIPATTHIFYIFTSAISYLP